MYVTEHLKFTMKTGGEEMHKTCLDAKWLVSNVHVILSISVKVQEDI